MSNGIESSKGASMFFFIMFIIFTVVHGILFIWKRAWYMLWFCVGGILEISGYSNSTQGHGSQSVQVIIAPVFLAASIYVSYGKLLKGNNAAHLSPLSSFSQSVFFIVGDILSFGLQVAGIVIGLIKNKRLGSILVILGFVIQLVCFTFFVTLIILVHRRLGKDFTAPNSETKYQWPQFLKVLYVVCVLFFIRILFRLIEYAQGWDGYIFSHAVFSYIFDGATTILSMIILSIFHPAFFIPKKTKEIKKSINDVEEG